MRQIRHRLWRTVQVCLTATAVSLIVPGIAAAAKLELTLGSPEPVESVATQLGAVVTNGGGYDFFMSVKPTGGAGCGANPEADNGEKLFGYQYVTEETNPVTITRNWTFESAGSYRVCAWLGQSSSEAVTKEETTLQVRRPHLALSISAPPAVSQNQTFQVLTSAQAETERPVYEYAIPNTGSGCPSNAEAASNASGAQTVLYGWDVTGGPFTESRNQSIEKAGVYLFCGYFEYEGTERPPELTASAQTTVTAPCLVPSFAFGAALASVEAQLRAASCSVGPLHYAASTSVHRGGVIGLSPRPGTSLATGASVAIDVSAGPPCVVPSIRPGTSQHHVEHALALAHCGYSVGHAHSRRARRGTVAGLGSRARSHLFPGTKVRIIVSSGR